MRGPFCYQAMSKPYKQPMYVFYNYLISISCITWRWP